MPLNPISYPDRFPKRWRNIYVITREITKNIKFYHPVFYKMVKYEEEFFRIKSGELRGQIDDAIPKSKK